jgi:hypothetical protein
MNNTLDFEVHSVVIGILPTEQGITMDQLQKNMDARAKNYDDFSSGKITYAESQRRDAKLRLDDSSISDSERLAGIEYQLTLLRIAAEERAR